jgi:hypothetical protein
VVFCGFDVTFRAGRYIGARPEEIAGLVEVTMSPLDFCLDFNQNRRAEHLPGLATTRATTTDSPMLL